MLVVRAWPEHPPAGRPHVVDGWRRVPVDDYDYRGLAGAGQNLISLDWDTAVAIEDLREFASCAAASPAQVLVAPVRTYYGPHPGQWNLATWDGQVYPGTGDPPASADLFGFGMVYLPAAMIAGFIAGRPGDPMVDQSFAAWHYINHGPASVHPSVRPVHLHYPQAQTGVLDDADQ